MEVYVVWGVSSLLIGELNCRNVIVQKSCFVEAQPSSKCSKYSVRMGVGIIRRYICHISLRCLKVHTSDNFVDIQDCGMILSRFQTWETCSFESSCSSASVTRACLVYNCHMIILFQIRSTLHVSIVTASVIAVKRQFGRGVNRGKSLHPSYGSLYMWRTYSQQQRQKNKNTYHMENSIIYAELTILKLQSCNSVSNFDFHKYMYIYMVINTWKRKMWILVLRLARYIMSIDLRLFICSHEFCSATDSLFHANVS